jgi:hypothetical protein
MCENKNNPALPPINKSQNSQRPIKELKWRLIIILHHPTRIPVNIREKGARLTSRKRKYLFEIQGSSYEPNTCNPSLQADRKHIQRNSLANQDMPLKLLDVKDVYHAEKDSRI